MEIQLIYGPNSSGKSKYAEAVAVAAGGKLIYLATMVPQNEENLQRIEKHRIQRRDKGFQTVEAGWDIDKIEADSETVILLEDASNLVANGIFMHGADAQEALEAILNLANRCKMLIIVSIGGLSAEGYDAETANYIGQLNWLNEKLEEMADKVVEMSVDAHGNPERRIKKLAKQSETQRAAYFRNEKCEYFPCHPGADPENHNCLFCYCPLYMLGDQCGGAFRYTKSGRKDCSDCTLPHRRENYDYMMAKCAEIGEAMKRKNVKKLQK